VDKLIILLVAPKSIDHALWYWILALLVSITFLLSLLKNPGFVQKGKRSQIINLLKENQAEDVCPECNVNYLVTVPGLTADRL
jgi:hypothetical protein